jgi:hypothetical protein
MEILSEVVRERNGEEADIRKVGEYRVCGLLRRRNCNMAVVVFVHRHYLECTIGIAAISTLNLWQMVEP